MTTTVLVTPDAPRFAPGRYVALPGRYVALPPIPCRTCGGKGATNVAADLSLPCPDCTDGTEPLTECLVATPGTECQWCFGRGFFTDNENDYSQTTRCLSGCTNGQRPGVVLGRATFGAGLPIGPEPQGDLSVVIGSKLGGIFRRIVSPDRTVHRSDRKSFIIAEQLGVWAVGNVAYPIESYTLVTDPGGCPMCGGEGCVVERTGVDELSLVACDVCRQEGHLTAPLSPPWLPTEPGVHRVEVEG